MFNFFMRFAFFGCFCFFSLAFPGLSFAEEEKRIAVLEFENTTKHTNYDYLSIGLAESTELSLKYFPEIIVLHRLNMGKILKEQSFGSTAFVEGSTAPEMGKILGANLLMTGGFQINESQILVTARIIDVQSGKTLHVFSHRGSLNNIFDFQDSFTQKSIEELQFLSFSKNITPQNSPNHPKSQTAYEYYLHGRKYYFQATSESFLQALTYFKKAIELDPDYALAWAAAAEVHALLGYELHVQENTASQKHFTQSLQAAQQAIKLAPNLAEAYRSQAYAYNNTYPRQQSAAVQAAEKALKLSPRDPESWYILAAAKGGDITLYKKALDLNPLFILAQNDLGYAYLKNRQYVEAEQLFRRMSNRNLVEGFRGLLELAIAQKNWKEAENLFPSVLNKYPDSAELHYKFAVTLQNLNKAQESLKEAQIALKINPKMSDAFLLAGLLCLKQGSVSQAHSFLRQYLVLTPNKDTPDVKNVRKILETER